MAMRVNSIACRGDPCGRPNRPQGGASPCDDVFPRRAVSPGDREGRPYKQWQGIIVRGIIVRGIIVRGIIVRRHHRGGYPIMLTLHSSLFILHLNGVCVAPQALCAAMGGYVSNKNTSICQKNILLSNNTSNLSENHPSV